MHHDLPELERSVLIDTHAHLDDDAFDADRTDVIRRAAEADVTDIILIGYREAIWDRTITIAGSFAGGWVALGVHPQSAAEETVSTLDRLRERVVAAGAVAIGEAGIDLFRDGPPLATQRTVFQRQLDLARELGLPTIIHQRAAERETLAILRELPPDQAIVLHSFDAGPETAALARERGWLLGAGGLMTRRSNETVRDILKGFPLEQLVLETDSPYLVPSGIRSRRNEPANVAVIAERLAGLRGDAVEIIASVTTANARRVFRLNR